MFLLQHECRRNAGWGAAGGVLGTVNSGWSEPIFCLDGLRAKLHDRPAQEASVLIGRFLPNQNVIRVVSRNHKNWYVIGGQGDLGLNVSVEEPGSGVFLNSDLAALHAIALILEPKQRFLAVLAPLLNVLLECGAIGHAFQDVAWFHGHRFDGHLKPWLRAL